MISTVHPTAAQARLDCASDDAPGCTSCALDEGRACAHDPNCAAWERCERCEDEPATVEQGGRSLCADCAHESSQMAEDDVPEPAAADIPIEKWRWYGYPQHLIVAQCCRFRLATAVGGHLISTVGDYHIGDRVEMTTIGAGPDAFFETMVFPVDGDAECGCCPRVTDWSGIETVRYATAKEAQRGHMDACLKYATKPSEKAPEPAADMPACPGCGALLNESEAAGGAGCKYCEETA